MPRPKRHHFVPQWYLAGFRDTQSGCLHAYDKTTKEFWTPKPKKVMVIKDYYQQKHAPDGIDPDILEKMLGSWLEPEAQRGFKKLINPPPNFREEDTSHLLAYLTLQRIRVPRQAQEAKRVIKEVYESQALQAPSEIFSSEAKTALMRGEIVIDIKDSFRFDFMKMLIRELNPYFARMAWEVARAEERGSFITSDSPVTFFNVACLPPNEAGIALVGTRVFFPLDSQHVLVLRHPEALENPSISPLDIVPEPMLEDRKIGVSYRVCDENQVDALNQIMLDLSDRVVVGRSKDILEKTLELVQ